MAPSVYVTAPVCTKTEVCMARGVGVLDDKIVLKQGLTTVTVNVVYVVMRGYAVTFPTNVTV